MNAIRTGLVLEASLALGRFLVTPTWPCALVALGSLALVALVERKSGADVLAVVEEVERVKAVVSEGLRDVSSAMRVDMQRIDAKAADAVARAERLEANRVLGG